MNALFTPSSTDLLNMIAAAEAKFDAARSTHMRERAERAWEINAQIIRESRQHDMRRRINAGDRP
jgi:hypothetical protein